VLVIISDPHIQPVILRRVTGGLGQSGPCERASVRSPDSQEQAQRPDECDQSTGDDGDSIPEMDMQRTGDQYRCRRIELNHQNEHHNANAAQSDDASWPIAVIEDQAHEGGKQSQDH